MRRQLIKRAGTGLQEYVSNNSRVKAGANKATGEMHSGRRVSHIPVKQHTHQRLAPFSHHASPSAMAYMKQFDVSNPLQESIIQDIEGRQSQVYPKHITNRSVELHDISKGEQARRPSIWNDDENRTGNISPFSYRLLHEKPQQMTSPYSYNASTKKGLFSSIFHSGDKKVSVLDRYAFYTQGESVKPAVRVRNPYEGYLGSTNISHEKQSVTKSPQKRNHASKNVQSNKKALTKSMLHALDKMSLQEKVNSYLDSTQTNEGEFKIPRAKVATDPVSVRQRDLRTVERMLSELKDAKYSIKESARRAVQSLSLAVQELRVLQIDTLSSEQRVEAIEACMPSYLALTHLNSLYFMIENRQHSLQRIEDNIRSSSPRHDVSALIQPFTSTGEKSVASLLGKVEQAVSGRSYPTAEEIRAEAVRTIKMTSATTRSPSEQLEEYLNQQLEVSSTFVDR